MTQLPNPFLNSTAIPEPPAVGDPAVALSRTSVLDAQTDATAEAFQSSDGRRQSLADGSFLSGSTLGLPDSSESSVASSDLQPRATAEQIQSSDGGVEGHASEETVSVAVRGLRERRPRDMEAAGSQREAETGWSSEMARVREQASNCTSQDSDRIAGPSAARDRAGIKPGPSEAIPASTGGPQEAPASAPTKNPDTGVLDATDCIHEIFHWVRKLMRGHQGFVLDEAEFMADVEEEPLFIRDGDHLRRWEA